MPEPQGPPVTVGEYTVGDRCEVYSHSAATWCAAVVKGANLNTQALHVEYNPSGEPMSKMIKHDSGMIRVCEQPTPDEEVNEEAAPEDGGPTIEWTPRSEYLKSSAIGEVVVYDANGAGLRDSELRGMDPRSAASPRLVALAHTLIERGAETVYVLGGGVASVLRRCRDLHAAAFTERWVDYGVSSPTADSAAWLGSGVFTRPEDRTYMDWMVSYRASLEVVVQDFLYLGNVKARHSERLSSLGIRYVLNAATPDLDEMAPLQVRPSL